MPKRVRFEFSPLLNIFLVLLTVLVLGFSLSIAKRFLPLDLPFDPASASSQHITLMVSADHTFYWNREGPLPVAELGGRLNRWLQKTHSPEVIIAGDKNARLGDTALVLDEVRHAGIKAFSVETHLRPTP